MYCVRVIARKVNSPVCREDERIFLSKHFVWSNDIEFTAGMLKSPSMNTMEKNEKNLTCLSALSQTGLLVSALSEESLIVVASLTSSFSVVALVASSLTPLAGSSNSCLTVPNGRNSLLSIFSNVSNSIFGKCICIFLFDSSKLSSRKCNQNWIFTNQFTAHKPLAFSLVVSFSSLIFCTHMNSTHMEYIWNTFEFNLFSARDLCNAKVITFSIFEFAHFNFRFTFDLSTWKMMMFSN